MAAHPHAALMAEFAKDAATTEKPWLLWQMKGARGTWYTCRVTPNWSPSLQYRRKVAVAKINSIEIPMPERHAPTIGAVFYVPNLSGEGTNRCDELRWHASDIDCLLLRRGLVHASHQAATQHAMALTSATRIAPD